MRASLLAVVIALVLSAPALADDAPLPDPTTPPAYAPTPGLVPPGALAPQPTTSARLALLSHRLLVLDTRHLRTTVEVRCRASAAGSCNANGTLTITLHGHKTQIGAWSGRIPGQQIFAPAFRLTTLARTLRPGHAIHGVLRLTNHAAGLRAIVGVQPITTVITLPVTILPLPPSGPPKPTVVSGPAGAITPPALIGNGGPGSATATGIVNPNGEQTTFHFEYGPAAGAYFTSTTESGLSGDRVERVVSATLAGLDAPSTVHYRLVATSDGGTTFGHDEHFAVPFVQPPLTGAPTSDVTAAGPVTLQVINNVCVASLGLMLAGTDLTCTITVLNPQPPVLGSGPSQVAVRPAAEVLAIHAPAGTIGATTHSATEPVPVVVPPQTAAVATAKFSILHAPNLGSPETAEAAFAPPVMATMPATGRPNVHLDVHCSSPQRPTIGAEVLCTVTALNTGFDTATFTALTLTPSAALNPTGLTTDGDPPLALRGQAGAQTSMTVRYLVAKGASPGDHVTVTAIADGIDETDLAHFEVSDESNVLVVATRQ